MFTGLVEELASIQAIEKDGSNLNIQIACSKVLEDIELGASIAVDGVCQTVTKFDETSFWVTAIKETLDLTNFQQLEVNSLVNLERCLRPQDRLGGHIVQGHVDSMASLLQVDMLEGSYELYFQIDPQVEKYIIYKGSIAINGISLTVAGIDNAVLKLCIIPKTWEMTNLAQLKIGDKVNVEVDQVAKYIEKLVSPVI
jgi:riboflavin synthase